MNVYYKVVGASNNTVSTRHYLHYLHGTQMANTSHG